MHPMETIDVVKELLRALQERSEPLIKELPPSPGSRAERFAQLLCPGLHAVDAPPVPSNSTVVAPTGVSLTDRGLAHRPCRTP